jgi:hypothetical protein
MSWPFTTGSSTSCCGADAEDSLRPVPRRTRCRHDQCDQCADRKCPVRHRSDARAGGLGGIIHRSADAYETSVMHVGLSGSTQDSCCRSIARGMANRAWRRKMPSGVHAIRLRTLEADISRRHPRARCAECAQRAYCRSRTVKARALQAKGVCWRSRRTPSRTARLELENYGEEPRLRNKRRRRKAASTDAR